MLSGIFLISRITITPVMANETSIMKYVFIPINGSILCKKAKAARNSTQRVTPLKINNSIFLIIEPPNDFKAKSFIYYNNNEEWGQSPTLDTATT
jgi:hypothetical protein